MWANSFEIIDFWCIFVIFWPLLTAAGLDMAHLSHFLDGNTFYECHNKITDQMWKCEKMWFIFVSQMWSHLWNKCEKNVKCESLDGTFSLNMVPTTKRTSHLESTCPNVPRCDLDVTFQVMVWENVTITFSQICVFRKMWSSHFPTLQLGKSHLGHIWAHLGM